MSDLTSNPRTPPSLLNRLRQASDPEAWDRLVVLYAPLIYSWCRRVGLQDQDASDLVQDVFVTLVKTLPTFEYDRRQGFRRWLRTVTLNKWRDRLKRRSEREWVGQPDGAPEAIAPDELAEFWETEYRQQLLGRALQIVRTDFQPATWKAFWEHAVEGRPAPEVAAELGLTPGAVYAAKLRVVERLRQELADVLE